MCQSLNRYVIIIVMVKLLECKNLNKSYDKTSVLKDINLEIEGGKIVGLLGRNGAGKTTLLKLINGLLTPTSGEILIAGNPVGVESKKMVSFLPERTFLDKTMTIKEAVKFFADFYVDFSVKKAERLLKDLDLAEDEKLSKISKGMLEKVQLALVMSRSAKLYILDEPLGGVDPATRDYILDTILQNFDKGASMIISTHLIADIERILDEVIFIDNGEVKLVEDADKLRAKRGKSIDEIFREEFKNVR